MTSAPKYGFTFTIFFEEKWHKGILILNDEPNFFAEPFSSICIKVAALLLYLSSLFSVSVLLAFARYETQGLAGAFRTLLNQLVSFKNLLGAIYCILVAGIDTIRICYGPLPNFLCNLNAFMKNLMCIMLLLVLSITIIFKFFYVVIWKTIKPMMDNFITIFVILFSFMIGIIFSSIKVFGPGVPLMAVTSCTGTYFPSQFEVTNLKLPIFQIFAGIAMIVHLILIIPILMAKKKLPNSSQTLCPQTKSLESLPLNFINMGMMMMSAYCTYQSYR